MGKEYLIVFDTEEERDKAFEKIKKKVFPFKFQGGKLQPDPNIQGSRFIQLMNTAHDKIFICRIDNSKCFFITSDGLKAFQEEHFTGRYVQGSSFDKIMETVSDMKNVLEFMSAVDEESFGVEF